MKKIYLLLSTLCVFGANAQSKFSPNTGDNELNNMLIEIDTKANKDIETFKQEVEQTLSLPKQQTEQLLQTMPAGDVYMIAQTANETSRPVDEIKQVYEKNKDKGWGVMAKELGIKPGSKEFKALKGKVKKNKGKGQGKDKNKKDKKDKKDEKDEKDEKSENKDSKGKSKNK